MKRMSAGSIFVSYLDSRTNIEPLSEFQEAEVTEVIEVTKPAKRCQKCRKYCKCCLKSCCCKNCCKCKKEKKTETFSGPEEKNGRDYFDEDEDNSESEEDETPKTAYCCGLFRLRKTKQSIVHQVDPEEWQEDLDKVAHVTPKFRDWLAHTYKNDRKAPAKVRKARMKARQSWLNIVTQSRASILSIRELDDDKADSITESLADISSWDFDSYQFHEKTDHHSLAFVTTEIFRLQDFGRKFRIKSITLKNLLKALEAGYTMNNNTYHNDRHAADVLQTAHAIINSRPGIYNVFTDLEIFALIFAAMIHDLAHPGTTNNFHINARTPLALLYNDRSILENHHVSQAFTILNNSTCNILVNLNNEEFKEFRSVVIDMVLATDMTAHFQNVKAIRSILKDGDWKATSQKTLTSTLSLILHAADIGNPAKPWPIHKHCTDDLMAEFRAQGVQEKALKLPVSPLCDAKDQNAGIQITFIELLVQPTFLVLGDLFDMILSNEHKDETFIAVKNRQKERRRATLPLEESEIIAPSTSVRLRSSFGISPMSSRRASVQPEENFRPWVPHLLSNIGHWKDIQEGEEPLMTPIPKQKSLEKQNSHPGIHNRRKSLTVKSNQVEHK